MGPANKVPVPIWAHFLCGWPLILVAFGGAIGGGLGGMAYGISISLFQTSLPMMVKIVAPILIGIAAVGIWLSIAVTVAMNR
ncbi:hypothetical protein DTL21_20170 [Bremerella cremea]|uniref:Uncharacterized protein n=1 Tax=Blastopirellula marina TaxID=124 RepID=A0A2S8FK21_9BACT|nr:MULTISPECIES: hypothetical protein [Pirellulaceae]PQO32528.1 hypothetical protein C5Y83_20150 [Blastopirellula marina]RCS45595.1 hypothetical protein DTL21_20170 [Bremerella cremea]